MCGMTDFRMQTAWFGHWIPAFAGMTDINPLICDCPAARHPRIDNEIRTSYTQIAGPGVAQLLMARWCSG